MEEVRRRYESLRRRGIDPFADLGEQIIDLGAVPGGYGHDILETVHARPLLDDLEHLSPAERAVLYLSEVDGYRFAEIGRMLGCSEAAARKRRHS